jgi:predicted PurR-regulated permease PerM
MNGEKPHAAWSPTTKIFVIALLLGFLVYLLWRFSAVITPLVLAVVIAYVLAPLVGRLQRLLHIPRVLATLLVYVVLLIVIFAIPALLAPTIAQQLGSMGPDFENIIQRIISLLDKELVLGSYHINGAQIASQVIDSLRGLLEPVFSQTFTLMVNVIGSIVWGVFILIISFYMIKDSDRLGRWYLRLAPPGYKQDFLRLKDEINTIWGAFFRGQLILSLVVTLIWGVVGLVIGLPFALVMALIGGLLEFLPSIGHAIWAITASLLMLFQGSTWIALPNWAMVLIVLGLYAIFTQVDLNVLIPRIIGRSVRLNPLVVILGIIAGAALAGVLGVVLAAPTIATARVLGRYIFAHLFDTNPFPAPRPREKKRERKTE